MALVLASRPGWIWTEWDNDRRVTRVTIERTIMSKARYISTEGSLRWMAGDGRIQHERSARQQQTIIFCRELLAHQCTMERASQFGRH